MLTAVRRLAKRRGRTVEHPRDHAKVAFLVRSLGYGGAERQLVMLARGLRERGHSVVVIVFYPGGPLEAELHAAGVPLRVVGKRGRWDVAGFAVRLGRLLRLERPAVLHPYLDVPNLTAAAIKLLVPRLRVVWGVRASELDLSRYSRFVRLAARLTLRLAGLPDLIVVNSQAGWDQYRSAGVQPDRLALIPNGIDTDRFRPDPVARQRVRSEWGVAEEERLVGLVGRLDPMKDHPTFLRAAAELARQNPSTSFVCVGEGPAAYAESLQRLAESLGLAGRVRWCNPRMDVKGVYNALDVACSASAYGEGFSNTTAEAMACAVPCVVTDVGDSARVVGDAGRVVPPGDPAVLAAAVQSLLATTREEWGVAARRRIIDHFSIERLLDATEVALWERD